MTGIELEILLEEIHNMKLEARGLERRNLQTLERVTEKLLTKKKTTNRKQHNPYWYFIIGISFLFLGFLGFFDASSNGFLSGGLYWLGGALVPSSWCIWKFLRAQ
jgi:hypothetical protein